jgi:hypothetical protein
MPNYPTLGIRQAFFEGFWFYDNHWCQYYSLAYKKCWIHDHHHLSGTPC